MVRLVRIAAAGLAGWLVLVVLAGALLDHGGGPRLLAGFGLVVAASALSLFGPIWLVPKRGGGRRVVVAVAGLLGALGLLAGLVGAGWGVPAAIQFGSWYRCVVGAGGTVDPLRHLVAPIGPLDECGTTNYARGTWITLALALTAFGGPTVAAAVARYARSSVHSGHPPPDPPNDVRPSQPAGIRPDVPSSGLETGPDTA